MRVSNDSALSGTAASATHATCVRGTQLSTRLHLTVSREATVFRCVSYSPTATFQNGACLALVDQGILPSCTLTLFRKRSHWLRRSHLKPGGALQTRHRNHAHRCYSKRRGAEEEEGERLREAAGCAPGRLVGCIRTAPGSILWPSHASAHRPAWYRTHGNLYGSRRHCRGFRGQVHARRSARRGRCARLSDAALVLLLREAGERAKQALSEVQQVR